MNIFDIKKQFILLLFFFFITTFYSLKNNVESLYKSKISSSWYVKQVNYYTFKIFSNIWGNYSEIVKSAVPV